jgi:hypothetical protein
MTVEQIQAISPILVGRLMLSDHDVIDIVAFLRSLEDRQAAKLEEIIPETVPSGLPVSRPQTGER